MTTIDKLDISVYNLYAIRTRMLEQIQQQLHLEEASSIPPQTHIMITQAQLSEMELLLGITPIHTPWAYFFPPKKFRTARRSPFSFSRVAASILATEEGTDEYALLQSINCDTPEEEREKGVLTSCFKEISKLNSWLSFIVGRIGQFLQG